MQAMVPTARRESATAAGSVKLKAEDVRVFYGEKEALHGVSMDIVSNEVIAFIGPSGCGKSTFLRCFNRMNDTVASARVTGRITLDGRDIHEPARRRRRVGADEEAFTAERGALQRLHDPALGLGLERDAGGHGHHRPALHPHRFPGGEGETSDTVRGPLTGLHLHGNSFGDGDGRAEAGRGGWRGPGDPTWWRNRRRR